MSVLCGIPLFAFVQSSSPSLQLSTPHLHLLACSSLVKLAQSVMWNSCYCAVNLTANEWTEPLQYKYTRTLQVKVREMGINR